MRDDLKFGLRRAVGEKSFERLRYAKYLISVMSRLMRGQEKECNLCGYKGRFRSFGHPPRYEAECAQCFSGERQRLFKLWADRNSERLRGAELLHFAPEQALRDFLQPLVRRYVSADINPHHADLVLNIEALDLPSNSYDVIFCSHVLEHVNDGKALAELHRVLRPSGLVVVMVPIIEGWETTYENDRVIAPQERERHFGQWDHVRYYGRDLRDRIGRSGFALEEFTAEEPYVQQFGLFRGEKIFLCTKRP